VVVVNTARVDADVRWATATIGPPRSPLAGLPSLIYHAADPLHGHHPAVEMRAALQGRRRRDGCRRRRHSGVVGLTGWPWIHVQDLHIYIYATAMHR